jgi:UDPglucose 6-dehydrogenase
MDISKAVAESDITFIIVPTPSMGDGSFTNQYILNVLSEMVPLLKEKMGFHIINIVSTVMPGTCEKEFIPYLEHQTGKKAGVDFGLAYNPEFIAIGSVINNFLNPDLVLIGGSDDRTCQTLVEVYKKTCLNSPYMGVTSLTNAEITKLSINCYCTMKISFANNLGMICDMIPGASASEITGILGHDSRIGNKYIKPGLGFGGPCFPRDNEAFIKFAKDVGGYSGLQEAVVSINRKKTDQAVEKILKAAELVGDKVAVLGLSYKPATYLTERSQSVDIITALSDCGRLSDLRAYDPMAKMNGKWVFADSLQSCVSGMNVAAILTPWPEFFDMRWQHEMAKERAILNFWE